MTDREIKTDLFVIFTTEFVNENTRQVVTLTTTCGNYKELGKYLTEMNKKIMENAKSNKESRLMRIMVVAWIIAATLGGCVVSLNIQKNNQNSTQSVSQENEATQKNDSTNFNMKIRDGKEQQ